MKQISLDIVNPLLATSVSPVFARHETFHPRFGWLKKGFDAALTDSGIFLRDDAPVRLGVGKNMARSIRYWCNAFKVLEEDSARQFEGRTSSLREFEGRTSSSSTRSSTASSNQKARCVAPKDFGSKLLSDDGWDPFLEDPASLWLLHWKLLSPPCYATAWDFTFNYFRSVEFSVDDLFVGLCDYRNSLSIATAESSLKKDITCILRMYAEQDAKTRTPVRERGWLPNEDTLDCPFSELGILATAGDSKHYTFRVGAKTNLPAEIIVSACLEFASWVGREQKTISISRLTFDPGSPGMAFKLNESAISQGIEQVCARWDAISFSDTAGLIQLSYTQNPAVLAEDILDRYYEARGGEAK